MAGSVDNFAYMVGTRIMTQALIPDRTAFAVATADEMYVTVCNVEVKQVTPYVSEVRTYTEFEDVPHQLLAQQMLEAGIRGRVGYERRWIPAYILDDLQAALAGKIELVPADALFDRLRAIKTPEEIAILEQAARATSRAICRSFTPGHETELDVAKDLTAGIMLGGASEVPFMVLASGRRALPGHPYPTGDRMQAGDAIRTDVGGRFGTYVSDLARTGVIGQAGAELKGAYAALAKIHGEILAAVRPGIPAHSLIDKTAELFKQARMPFNPHLVGHNLGISAHEWPILNVYETAALETGMVLCIEHGYATDSFKLHIENTGVLTESGLRLFSEDDCPWQELLQL
jgi:Xaa-Pro aminopeptidase